MTAHSITQPGVGLKEKSYFKGKYNYNDGRCPN